MAVAEIEDVVERALVHSLSQHGHALYMAHPATHETITLVACAENDEIEKLRRRFRRVLYGVVAAALEASRPQPPAAPSPATPGPEEAA